VLYWKKRAEETWGLGEGEGGQRLVFFEGEGGRQREHWRQDSGIAPGRMADGLHFADDLVAGFLLFLLLAFGGGVLVLL